MTKVVDITTSGADAPVTRVGGLTGVNRRGPHTHGTRLVQLMPKVPSSSSRTLQFAEAPGFFAGVTHSAIESTGRLPEPGALYTGRHAIQRDHGFRPGSGTVLARPDHAPRHLDHCRFHLHLHDFGGQYRPAGDRLGVPHTAVVLGWIPLGYILTGGAGLMPAGQLSDLGGRKRVFLRGMIVFTVSPPLRLCAFRRLADRAEARPGCRVGPAVYDHHGYGHRCIPVGAVAGAGATDIRVYLGRRWAPLSGASSPIMWVAWLVLIIAVLGVANCV